MGFHQGWGFYNFTTLALELFRRWIIFRLVLLMDLIVFNAIEELVWGCGFTLSSGYF